MTTHVTWLRPIQLSNMCFTAMNRNCNCKKFGSRNAESWEENYVRRWKVILSTWLLPPFHDKCLVCIISVRFGGPSSECAIAPFQLWARIISTIHPASSSIICFKFAVCMPSANYFKLTIPLFMPTGRFQGAASLKWALYYKNGKETEIQRGARILAIYISFKMELYRP